MQAHEADKFLAAQEFDRPKSPAPLRDLGFEPIR